MTATHPGGQSTAASLAPRRWTACSGLMLLVADPDTSEQARVVDELHRTGVETIWCPDGASALVTYGRVRPHAVLIAPHLGTVDAATVVCAIRAESTTPVMVRVGPGEIQAAGPALLAGASAVSGPYRPQEVVRHLGELLPDVEARMRLAYGPLELDPSAYSVRLHGEELEDFAPKEFELLRVLMAHADQVITAEEITRAIWGTAAQPPSPNTIAVHVARLRARLDGAVLIKRIRGRGYRLTSAVPP